MDKDVDEDNELVLDDTGDAVNDDDVDDDEAAEAVVKGKASLFCVVFVDCKSLTKSFVVVVDDGDIVTLLLAVVNGNVNGVDDDDADGDEDDDALAFNCSILFIYKDFLETFK